MKPFLFIFILYISLVNCHRPPTVSANPIDLFNGNDLRGWHIDVPEMDTNKSAISPFLVRNHELISMGVPNGHIITDEKYKDYTLEIEYRFVGKPGNCGVLVHASTPRILYKMFPKSIEVQMMHQNAGDFWCIGEDISVIDMEKRRGKKENWGVTEGKERRIINLTDGSEKPLGEWNKMKIICKGNTVKAWVNDIFVNDGFDCTASEGQIALQAEGAEVAFRKVMLIRN